MASSKKSNSNYYTYGTNLRDKEFFTSTVTTTKNGIKRYFSNIDAEIYFGNTLIDDIFEFQFSIEEKKLPVFSYNKFIADIIIPGQRVVQGTFALNFTDGKYLRGVLSDIDDSVLNTSYFDEELYNPSGDNKNTALYNKNFDITISYGDESSYNATSQTLCGVQITSQTKALSAKTGEPILEIYSFIAKDFIDDEDHPYYEDNEKKKEEESKDKDNSNKDKNDSTSNSSSSSGNNKSEANPKGLRYKAVFVPEADANTPGTITLRVTNKDNKEVDLSSGSKTALITITDKNVLNYNIPGDSQKNFSAVTTLTTRKYNAPSSNSNEYLSYSIKLQGSNHGTVTNLNGQANRPIHKRLALYCAYNPEKKISANIKLTIDSDSGKTYNIDKDIEMIYAPNGYDW